MHVQDRHDSSELDDIIHGVAQGGLLSTGQHANRGRERGGDEVSLGEARSWASGSEPARGHEEHYLDMNAEDELARWEATL